MLQCQLQNREIANLIKKNVFQGDGSSVSICRRSPTTAPIIPLPNWSKASTQHTGSIKTKTAVIIFNVHAGPVNKQELFSSKCTAANKP